MMVQGRRSINSTTDPEGRGQRSLQLQFGLPMDIQVVTHRTNQVRVRGLYAAI